jgi:hypothetical protein
MLQSGTVKLGMVVASDMDPEPGISGGFSFPCVGGAVLLSADDSRAGFTAFQFATFPEFAELFHSYVDWQDRPESAPAPQGRNILTVEIADSYITRALECAKSTARELADAPGIHLSEIDLMIATASVPGSPTDSPPASAYPRRESRHSPTISTAHTPPHPPSRWNPQHSQAGAPRCSSPPALESRSRPRSIAPNPTMHDAPAPPT